jgi:hypothetical protein
MQKHVRSLSASLKRFFIHYSNEYGQRWSRLSAEKPTTKCVKASGPMISIGARILIDSSNEQSQNP